MYTVCVGTTNTKDLDVLKSFMEQHYEEKVYSSTWRRVSHNIPEYLAMNVINIAKSYLSHNHFSIYSDDVVVELHRRLLRDGEPELSEIGWHTDNDTERNERVNTVVFYLHNSMQQGGNFEYKPGSEGVNLCTPEVAKSNWTESKRGDYRSYEITVRSGMVVCFDGEVEHRPTPCVGPGRRDCIVVQFIKDN